MSLLIRFVLVAFAAAVLTACLSDVPDEPSAASETATPGSSSSSRPTQESSRPEIAIATVTPVRPVRRIEPPGGTTGIGETASEDIEYDQACLDGDVEAEASPSAIAQSPTPTAGAFEFPGPYKPIPPVLDEVLQSQLDAIVGDRADTYAYYVKDLQTGRTAAHNAGEAFNAASLFKLFVMYEVFRQEDAGLIDWGDELVVTPYYDAFALSPRVTELCQVITVGEAMEAMLSVSDNAAAVLLQDLAGSANVNAAIETLGVKDSGLFEDGLPVTADDLGLLMEAIATGNAVGPEASADMLRLLEHDVFDNGLISGVPAGTIVWRKTGNWADATNVAGVVQAPFGPYVFVALTNNGYETDVIQALSNAVYEYFEATSARRAP